MTKMDNVMTVRLPKDDIRALEQLSRQEKIDKSTALRELVEMGKLYMAVSRYADGTISIGKAAETAGLNMGEMLDLLQKLGIKSRLEPIDYAEGLKASRKLF